MQTISDIIEQFLLEAFDDQKEIELSRNELAEHFKCVPSQINYVLSTRFTLEKGYVIDSQRGGGGYVKIYRIEIDDDFKDLIFEKIGDSIDYVSASGILNTLCSNDVLSEEQKCCLDSAISVKSLKNPFRIEDEIRARILKNALTMIYKEKEK